jgi:hypothetical protein
MEDNISAPRDILLLLPFSMLKWRADIGMPCFSQTTTILVTLTIDPESDCDPDSLPTPFTEYANGDSDPMFVFIISAIRSNLHLFA